MAETPFELLAEIEKLEQKHLDNPTGRYFVPLANAYRKLGELEHAETRLREGLRKHPDYLSAHIVLGRVLADRGANVEAAEEFRYVLSVDPQNLIALRTLGELAVEEGRTEEAGRWYRELLGVDPMNDEARQALIALDARSSAPQGSEPDGAAHEEFEEFEGGGWWTQPDPPSEVGAAPLDGVAHGPVDDWGGAAIDLDLAPPAVDPAAAYAGGMHGEFAVGGEAAVEPLLEVAAGDAATLQESPEFSDAGDYVTEFGGDDEEFVTETIADLYARQGFYDRAADVYRELIRQRGPDAGLMRRLAEVERMAAGEPEMEVVEVAEELPVLDGFDVGAHDAAEPGFEPAVAVAVDGTEGAQAPASDAFAASFAGGFGGLDPSGGVEEAGASPEAEPMWEIAAADDLATPADAAAPGATVAGMLGELLAWRAPEPAPQEVEEELRASFSFDEYFGAETATVAPVEPGEPTVPNADAAALEPLAEAPAAPEADMPAGDDEDLESFQAWLRSLKR